MYRLCFMEYTTDTPPLFPSLLFFLLSFLLSVISIHERIRWPSCLPLLLSSREQYQQHQRVFFRFSFPSLSSPTLEHIVEAAEKKNIVFVVAAGNHKCDLGAIEKTPCLAEDGTMKGYPAAYSDRFFNLISVGATEINGRVASFTNFDSSATHARVQVMAPGRDLPSCNDQKQSLDGMERHAGKNQSFLHPRIDTPICLSTDRYIYILSMLVDMCAWIDR